MQLRILTWNLWWRFGDWEARQRAIRSVLQKHNADVCCFQEVWSIADTSAAHLLAKDLGLHCVFFPSAHPEYYRSRTACTNIGIGNAMLSRSPIVRSSSETLTCGDAGDEGRLVSVAEIETQGGPLSVFTTHLNSGLTDSAVRVLQVSQVAAFVRTYASPGLPPVLAGDFNCEPDADEIRMITGRSKPPQHGFGLRDAWRLVREDAGATWSRKNAYVALTPQLPDSRIDYVFIGYPQGDRDLAVRSCDLVGDAPVDGIWPSDHFGVQVDCSIVIP